MKAQLFVKKRVLVVGGVLLDVVGRSNSSEEGAVSCNGHVSLSIGGAAFNFAANIANQEEKNIDCYLITALKKDSLTNQIIKDTIEKSNVKTDHIVEKDGIDEPVYVSTLFNHSEEKIETRDKPGITSSPIELIDLINDKKIEKAVSKSDLVVVDTNLSSAQLQHLNKLCEKHKIKIVASIVSDSKINRIHDHSYSKKFDLISLNKHELGIIHNSDLSCSTSDQITELCNKLHSKSLIITAGEDGYCVCSSDGAHKKIKSKEPNRLVSTLGSGDALLSAACLSLLYDEDITSSACEARITSWTSSVLGRSEANLAPKPTKDAVNKSSNKMSIAGYTLFILAISVMLLGIFLATTNQIEKEYYYIFLAVTSVLASSFGACIKRILNKNTREHNADNNNELRDSILLGIGAATIYCFNASLPHITSTKIESLDSSSFISILVSAFVYSIIIGFVANTYLIALAKKGNEEITSN